MCNYTCPISIAAPSDYDSLANAPLIFQPGNTRVCVSVTINDDTMLEETEAFTVTLTTQDSRVNLQRTTATITIRDTDRMIVIITRAHDQMILILFQRSC